MKRNIVQDVVPPRKSIRDIDLPSRVRGNSSNVMGEIRTGKDKHTHNLTSSEYEVPIKIEPSNNSKPPIISHDEQFNYDFDEPKKRSKLVLYSAGVFLLIVLAFGVSAIFRSAEVRITPREMAKNMNGSFTAKKEISPNGLSFQVVSISKETEKNVDPTQTGGQERVERKASGRIVIYNNFSSEVQKLVATTRFETPEGLVYRIKDPVAVPGKTTKDGKVVPGSIEVTVEADKIGPTYNIGLKDFTIPGFKGDPRYKDMYARSKTEMSGGFSGVQKVVSKDALINIEKEMEQTLKTSLYNDLVNQIPADYILFPDSLSYRFDTPSQSVTATGDVIVKMRGVTAAVIFNKASLSKAIQTKVLSEAGDDGVIISNLDKLKFSYTATTTLSNTTSTVSFNLNGEPNFVWIFDENKLKTDLLGLSKKNAKIIISSYPGIKEAWILTRPFWNQKIPNDPENVTLVNTLQN